MIDTPSAISRQVVGYLIGRPHDLTTFDRKAQVRWLCNDMLEAVLQTTRDLFAEGDVHGDSGCINQFSLAARLIEHPAVKSWHVREGTGPIDEDVQIAVASLHEAGLQIVSLQPSAWCKSLRDAYEKRTLRPILAEAERRLKAGQNPTPELLSAINRHLKDAEDASTGAGLAWKTGEEIEREAVEDTRWAVAPLFPLGVVSELSGAPKASGKTTLTLAAVRSKLKGAPFLGEAVSASPVVYLTEQPSASFREALRRAGVLGEPGLHVLYHHDTKGMPWPDVMQAAIAKCNQTGAELLVVDTLPALAGLAGEDENSAGAALQAVAPLLQAAGEGIGVVAIRHERKGGGAVGESGRGSSAFTGAVDVVLSLRRPEGNHKPSVREIRSLSRFDEIPERLMVDNQDGYYANLGSGADYGKEQARDKVLEALPHHPECALTLSDIQVEGVKRTYTQTILKDLAREGLVYETGTGRRNDPYRYHRANGVTQHA